MVTVRLSSCALDYAREVSSWRLPAPKRVSRVNQTESKYTIKLTSKTEFRGWSCLYAETFSFRPQWDSNPRPLFSYARILPKEQYQSSNPKQQKSICVVRIPIKPFQRK